MLHLSTTANRSALTVPPGVVSSSDVEGVAVFDREGTKLGRVGHLMIDKATGRVRSVTIVTRGFLGVGHSHLELPWQSLRYSRMLHAFVAAPSDAQV